MSYIDADKKFIVVWGAGYQPVTQGYKVLNSNFLDQGDGYSESEQMAINALEVGEALTFHAGGTLSVVRIPDEVVPG